MTEPTATAPPPRLVRQSITGSPMPSVEIPELPSAAYRCPSVRSVHRFTATSAPRARWAEFGEHPPSASSEPDCRGGLRGSSGSRLFPGRLSSASSHGSTILMSYDRFCGPPAGQSPGPGGCVKGVSFARVAVPAWWVRFGAIGLRPTLDPPALLAPDPRAAAGGPGSSGRRLGTAVPAELTQYQLSNLM